MADDPRRKRKCLPDHALQAHLGAIDALSKIDKLAESARGKLSDGNTRRAYEALQEIQIEALRAKEQLKDVRLATPKEEDESKNDNGFLIIQRTATRT